jgi:hypothetical protein
MFQYRNCYRLAPPLAKRASRAAQRELRFLGSPIVKCEKRSVTTTVAVIILSMNCAYAQASGQGNIPTAIAVLQAKADQAQPRDRCFLYAELVSQLTDVAIKQVNAGDSGQASETLKLVSQYIENIRLGVADNSRKLKEAELLMEHSSFRLKGLLNEAAGDDRPTLLEALKKLYQVQTQLMMQVFEK